MNILAEKSCRKSSAITLTWIYLPASFNLITLRYQHVANCSYSFEICFFKVMNNEIGFLIMQLISC